jgi:hypothetical protein
MAIHATPDTKPIPSSPQSSRSKAFIPGQAAKSWRLRQHTANATKTSNVRTPRIPRRNRFDNPTFFGAKPSQGVRIHKESRKLLSCQTLRRCGG